MPRVSRYRVCRATASVALPRGLGSALPRMCRCHRFRAVSRHAPRTAVTAFALSRAMHRRCHRLCTVPCHAPPLSPPLRRVVPCTAAVATFALYRAMHRRCRHLCAVSCHAPYALGAL